MKTLLNYFIEVPAGFRAVDDWRDISGSSPGSSYSTPEFSNYLKRSYGVEILDASAEVSPEKETLIGARTVQNFLWTVGEKRFLLSRILFPDRSVIQTEKAVVHDVRLNPPNPEQLVILAGLCSALEWDIMLATSQNFIAATTRSLAETEETMSRLLGRKISLSQPALKGSENDSL